MIRALLAILADPVSSFIVLMVVLGALAVLVAVADRVLVRRVDEIVAAATTVGRYNSKHVEVLRQAPPDVFVVRYVGRRARHEARTTGRWPTVVVRGPDALRAELLAGLGG